MLGILCARALLSTLLFSDQVLLPEALLVLCLFLGVLRRLTRLLSSGPFFLGALLGPLLLPGSALRLRGQRGPLRLQTPFVSQQVLCLLGSFLLGCLFLFKALCALLGRLLLLELFLLCGVSLPTCSGASLMPCPICMPLLLDR